MQINEGKGFPQILYGIDQDKDQRSVSLKPGFEYEIELYPYGQVSTEDFRHMSLSKRSCRLMDETMEGATHPIYTKANCLYDCRIQQALNKCLCIPWDFVNSFESPWECDIFGRTCFFNVIENITHAKDQSCSHCIEECDWIQYRRKVVTHDSLELKEDNEYSEYSRFCNKYICIDPKRYSNSLKIIYLNTFLINF